MRRCWIAIALFVGLLAAPAQAQQNDYSFFFGNWDIVWDKPDGTVRARVSFDDKGPSIIRFASGYGEFNRLTVQGGLLDGSAEGKKIRVMAGGNVAVGTWDEHPMRWQRVVQRVERVDVEPAEGQTLDYAKMRQAWEEARLVGNLPGIVLHIRGSGLPSQVNDAKMLRLDDRGLINPIVSLPRGADGSELLVSMYIRNPRLGVHKLWLNGQEIEWTLRMKLEGDCRSIGLSADPPAPRFGEKGQIRWNFLPAGCRPAEVDNDTSHGRVQFTAAAPDILNFDPSNERGESATVPSSFVYAANKPGVGLVQARFRDLVGELKIPVQPRPPCLSMSAQLDPATVVVDGSVGLRLPWADSNGVAQPGTAGVQFLPSGCSIEPGSTPSIGLAPADLAQLLGNQKIHGIAPGTVTVDVTWGTLRASMPLTVTAQPPCDRLGVTYEQRLGSVGKGTVIGVSYLGGVTLTYTRNGAPDGQRFACTKPPGAPLFFALTPNVQVDRTSGVATLGDDRPATIGVLHGTLWATDTIRPQPGAPACDKLTAYLPSGLAIGDRRTILVTYLPVNCPMPPGRVSFTADDLRVANINVDGVLVATAPGSTTITVRHGDLSATVPLAVQPPTPCTSMTAHADPAKTGSYRRVRITLRYLPQYCVQPDTEAQISLPRRLHMVGKDGDTWIVETFPGNQNTFEGEIVVRHGPFTATAALEYDDADQCRIIGVRLTPAQIAPRDSSQIQLTTEPTGCNVSSNSLFVSDPTVARLVSAPSGATLLGLAGGSVKVTAVGGAESNVLRVQAPNCTAMELAYYPTNVPAGHVAAAEISYTPAGCTRPAGQVEFSSDAPNRIQLVTAVPGATIRANYAAMEGDRQGAVIGRAGAPGRVTISARHGNLTAIAVLSHDLQ